MFENGAHLGHLRHWYIERVDAGSDLRILYKEAEAWAFTTELLEEIEAKDFTDDERLALLYEVWMEQYLIVNFCHPEHEQAAAIEQYFDKIRSARPAGPLSAGSQAFQLLSLVGMGTRRGVCNLPVEKVDALLERIPEDCRNSLLWYYLTSWAFLNGHLKYIQAAMEIQTIYPVGFSDDYFWLRTNLMHLMMTGRADRRDIVETITAYAHPRDIPDFRRFFLTKAEELGLIDAEIMRLLEAQELKLEELHGTPYIVKPKTRRFRQV